MTCQMCKGIGWVLDSNGAGMTSPKSLEFIECFHPECDSACEVASLVFLAPLFNHASIHPTDRYVMSVSAALAEAAPEPEPGG